MTTAAAAATPVVSEQTTTQQPMFDISQPPDIEGFTPLSRPREETFQEKFMRKSKENPFVPIGELPNELTLNHLVIRVRLTTKTDNRSVAS
uniref:Uncharacterized protein n=1 Tax=Hucho hucho TaxID=62062 RepID=A0A4W5JAZ6_9TELE